ncbi:5'/3'-nucleotidase SurE [Nocardioides stalactiti]|uniref:5'/3'-nucleotidase SurE n=1 Tax=Nocardioides stalactiti TaxID=2755356 RepID=UPI001600F21E|nr:5'/3'-nucleotidase SurE [Nocardioides stalactiti]
MSNIPVRRRLVRLAVACVATAAVAVPATAPTAVDAAPPTVTPTSAAQAPPTPLDGLRVMLTNDDSARGLDPSFGTDGKGLYELRKALCAAGADVLTVAPYLQQSGAGARMTTPGFSPVPLTVQAVTPPAAYVGDCGSAPSAGAVFGACQGAGPCSSSTPSASPADAVNIALSRFAANYWGTGPDVVLSGVNFGQNVGTTLNHSGTVGAVVTAHEYDVPAIAFSAEVPRELAQIPNVPFAATAAFAVRLLEELRAGKALKPDLVLNVNHPFVTGGGPAGGPVATVTGTSSDLGLTFSGTVPASGGTYQLTAGAPETETRQRADTTALAADKISVTRLDGDWSISQVGPPVNLALYRLR